jgi:NTP pyrophosphatase (non-canonical NTP hydrolase)
MDYFELECAVEHWAEEKEILSKATPMAQALKTLEECTELGVAVNNNDRAEIIDAMGDIMVTLIIQAKMQGLKLEECLESAYNVIAKRTGKMINGQFVKDYDDLFENYTKLHHGVSKDLEVDDFEDMSVTLNDGLDDLDALSK